LLHDLIVPSQPLAIIRAGAADRGAYPAGEVVAVRAPKHEVGRGLADLAAVQQQDDVRGFSVAAAHLETVGDGLETDAVTSQTLFDALLHFTADG
jgi:hypothetical protein